MERNNCGTRYDSYQKGIKDFCNQNYLSSINKYYMFDNWNCAPGPYAYEDANGNYIKGPCNGLNNQILPGGPCTTGDIEYNREHFLSALNNGGPNGKFHIVYHTDHGGKKGMGTSGKDKNQGISNNDFDDLENGVFQQILYTNSCEPATFNYDCIAKHYVNNPNGGGVAFIGDSDVGYRDERYQLDSLLKALYKRGFYNLGVAFQRMTPNNGAKRRLHLLGDPEMPVWTDTPQTFAFQTMNISWPNANGEAAVNIALQSGFPADKTAIVCIKKGDECYVIDTVTTTLRSFVFKPHTSGTLSIVVTAQNYKPYVWDHIVHVEPRNLYISNLTFKDDKTGAANGNGDGQLDAGETIETTIQLKNMATSNATNVSAVLTCNRNDIINIITGTSTFGTIAAGAVKDSPTQYVFKIDKDAPEVLLNEWDQVKFTLQITATINGAVYNYTDKFNIDIFTPQLEQGNKTILTGNIAAGETITMNIDLFNRGKAQATWVTAGLSSPYITDSKVKPMPNYPSIGKYETKTNYTAYQFTIDASYLTGQPLPINLQVTNEYGKLWNYSFDLTQTPDTIPGGDSIQFSGDRTSIKLWWKILKPLASIKGYNIYRCYVDQKTDDEIGDYVKLNTFVFPAAFYNDTGLEELTKYKYKVSAVDTAGNEGALSDWRLAWTSYPLMDGFPVEMNVDGSIRSSVNVADVNGDGNKEIFTSMRIDNENGLLIGLKHDGMELYNLDGNTTTFTGFAKLNAATFCAPALGDINQDGIFEVISNTRNESGGQNYLYYHQVQDSNGNGAPDSLFSTNLPRCYRSPIIADLNNDGMMETVVFMEYGGIRIYSATGQLLHTCRNNLNNDTLSGAAYGAIAVADINNNGYKEIIGCYTEKHSGNSGICIWKHDGTLYDFNKLIFYKLANYNFKSSVIVCDLNNDGNKEILTVAFSKTNSTQGRIIAIRPNGALVSGWNGSQTIAIPNNWHTTEIAVGDLNGDGNLEVVVVGKNEIKIWNQNGVWLHTIPIQIDNLEPWKITPVLADVDNTPDVEIIIANGNRIEAYKMDGTKVVGFPLVATEGFAGMPCVADIDHDGNNELIAGSGNTVYAWKTFGSPAFIEWGCERANCHNTGEYSKIPCTDLIINSNTTWTTPQKPCGNIIVQSGATLTVKNLLYLGANRSITIQPGAKLIVDGGVLTNACPSALWKGITVLGDLNLPPNTLYQGYVQVINGGKIENAQYGITVKAGGIVTGTNADFVNNTIGVFFDDQATGGSFTRTHFELNDNYLGETGSGAIGDKRDFEAHIKMWNSGNVTVTGCTFTSTAPYYTNSRNLGISALNSFLEVKEYCTKTPLPGKFCNEPDMTKSRFQGLTLGIKSYNFGTLPRLKVRFSIFKDNLKGGIEFNYSNYLEMIKNEFIITQSGSYGLYVSGATGYKIEENWFEDNLHTANEQTTGLKIGNSGSPENEVYKNEYKNLYIAQQFMDKNSSLVDTTGSGGPQPIKDKIPPVTGLQTLCNVFTNSRFRDIYAGYLPATHNRNSIRTHQGALLSPAGNDFYGNPPLNIDYTLSQHEINYYYDVNTPNSKPNNVTSNVTTIPTTASNGCPSKIGNNPPPTKGGYEEFLTRALRQYDEWNEQYEYWLAQWYGKCGEDERMRGLNDERIMNKGRKGEKENENLTLLHSYALTLSEECEYILQMISYYSALKDNYFNGIIVVAMSEEEEESTKARKHEGANADENLTFLRSYALTVFENLRYLFSYRNNYTDNLCIVETYLAENNFGEALTSLSKMVKQFELDEEQIFELKGLEIYIHWLQQLEEREKTIYSLPEEDIMQLVNYVETNTGRGVAFAKGILCGVYDICLEEEENGDDEMIRGLDDVMIRGLEDEVIENQSKSAQSVSSEFQNSITLVPNPTTGELTINNEQLTINNIEIYDVSGKKLSSNHHITSSSHHLIISSSHHLINISHLQAGIYFVKITTEAGVVVKKVVKQ
jgi:hypothetical protein